MGILDKLKSEFKSMQNKGAYRRAAESQIKKKEQAAYYKAKEMEAIKFAKKRAAEEYKVKSMPKKTMGNMSFVSAPSPQPKKEMGTMPKIPSWNASIKEVSEYHRKRGGY